jgi:type II secretory pathway predicted ATPase ExeA
MNAAVQSAMLRPDRDHAHNLLRAAVAFRELRDPAAMFAIDSQQRALVGLVHLIEDGNAGCGLLTGQVGLGKTLLRSALHQAVSPERCALVAIESGLLGFDDLMLEIVSQMRGERLTATDLPGRYERLAAFKELLATDVIETGRHLVLLLDDADQFDLQTLEALGALTNLASDEQAFVVPVLFGQPALRQKLARLPSLRQRIGAQYALSTLSARECAGYVEHRLRHFALEPADVLLPGFSDAVHAASGGAPRAINALCRQALRLAATEGRDHVGPASVEAARARLPDAVPASAAARLGT